jgi:CubicO group peptidase (beta-lactamase class C family)
LPPRLATVIMRAMTHPPYPLPTANPIDAALESAIAHGRIVGATIRVACNGQILYQRSAGLADREAGSLMRDDAIFLLSSLTKLITATAVLALVEQGRLRLDHPASRWLAAFRPCMNDGSSPPLTVHQLLTHTAGLSYEFGVPPGSVYRALGISSGLDAPGLSLAENMRRLGEAPLCFAPGSDWRYSMATDVLGAIIEAASDRPLPDAIARLVTIPLEMSHSHFHVSDTRRLATPYADGDPKPLRMGESHLAHAADGVSILFVPGRIFAPDSYPSGGVGMAGTAVDFLALLEALRTGRGVLRAPTAAAMLQDQLRGSVAPALRPGWGFGYGGAVLVDPALAGTPQAAGTVQWSGVYGHTWFIDPVNGISAVILTNTTFEGAAGRFTVDMRDAIYSAARA